MTAPELVEVVQAALAAHQRLTLALYPDYYCCTCGERSIEQPSAHQARAVLDALTEAGEVEWGVAWKGAGPSGVLAFDSEGDAREAVELGGLLSRLTLPCERAE